MDTGLIRDLGLPHLQSHPIPPKEVIFAVTKMHYKSALQKMLMFVSQLCAKEAELCRITHAWIRTGSTGVTSEWMEP